MPRNTDRKDKRVELWLPDYILKKAAREAKRRGLSRKEALEQAAREGLKTLKAQDIQELPLDSSPG